MRQVRDLLKIRRTEKDKRTERGEIMKYFCKKLNVERREDGYSDIPMPAMGKILQGIPTKDLYYLQSVCEDAKNFSKKFWWEVKNAMKDADYKK